MALAFFLAGMIHLSAQSAVPASPVDPNQARPAQPVEPAQPAAGPAAPAASSTATNVPVVSVPSVVVSVIADSSLRQVLQELAQSWADSQDSNPQVPLTLTNAGTMRAKIESGTVWDVVISADMDDVKDLTAKGLIMADGQRSLARNTLVIYGRKALIKDDELEWFDLVGGEWKKVAMGNPDLVASGRAAKRALEKHNLTDDDHKDVYVYAATEALALSVAARDQADAVFFYKTDLASANLPGFEPVAIKTEDAPPIFYTASVSRLAKNPQQARAFLDYCSGDAAKEIWTKYGFEPN